jgi:GNAT superfamily N-acetyltransferase
MSSELVIRNAKDDDAEALSILLTQLGYPQESTFIIRKLREFSDGTSARVFVAEENRDVLGFLTFDSHTAFHRDGRIGIITAMCVLESGRSRGIGRQLVEHAESFAKENGCVRIAVASGMHRMETHTFYRNLGYEEKTKRFIKEL